MAVNHTPVSFDLNLQHLCVFGTSKAIEGQAARRALGLIQRNVLVAIYNSGAQAMTSLMQKETSETVSDLLSVASIRVLS